MIEYQGAGLNRVVSGMAARVVETLAESGIEVSEQTALYVAANMHTLTLTLLEAAEQEREEHYEELRKNCQHYGGPLDYKFDGGRLPAYCRLCGQPVFYGRPKGNPLGAQ